LNLLGKYYSRVRVADACKLVGVEEAVLRGMIEGRRGSERLWGQARSGDMELALEGEWIAIRD
jgi:hypothetical protein